VTALVLAWVVASVATMSYGQVGQGAWPEAPANALFRDQGWFAPPEPTSPAARPAEPVNVFVIPIKDEISGAMADAVRRKVALCKGKGADLVIFEMDTPGGGLDPTMDIAEMITKDLAGVYTVAFVPDEAISGGAIVSLACNEIVLAPTGRIGDAMPIMIGPQGLQPLPKHERAKIESYLRNRIRILAEENGHSIALAEGMVTLEIEVWLVRHRRSGELRVVNPDKDGWRRKVTDPPDSDENPKAEWDYLRTVDSKDELVTLTGREAHAVALTRDLIETRRELLSDLNVTGGPEILADTQIERLIAFLTSPAATTLLFAIGILGAYTEIRTPGFGAPGIVAIVCFAVLFGSRYLTGLAEWWELIVLAIGVALLILEVTVIPGFGIAGIAGIICILVGLMAIILPNAPGELPIPRTKLDWEFFSAGLFALLLGLVLSVIGAGLVGRYLPKMPGANKLILAEAAAYSETTATVRSPVHHVAVGDEGIVESPCRPIGKVRFGSDLVDAVTEGDMIEPGARVTVLRRAGNRVIVERTEHE